MDNGIKYAHTNIAAKDWKSLSEFYIKVFNCKRVPPQKHLVGEWISRGTNIQDIEIHGIHLALPGANGATLEIFEFSPGDNTRPTAGINTQGLAHLAFTVDSPELVDSLLLEVKNNGGGQIGELVKKKFDGVGVLTLVYSTDPEGNIVEILNWDK